MTTAQRTLEALARGKRCILCHEEPRVAWLPMLPFQVAPGGVNTYPHEFRLRCGCYPKAPVLEKLPKSELSKAIADPSYATDAVTRMQAERIIAKRERP